MKRCIWAGPKLTGLISLIVTVLLLGGNTTVESVANISSVVKDKLLLVGRSVPANGSQKCVSRVVQTQRFYASAISGIARTPLPMSKHAPVSMPMAWY